jgi:hypothetical protein
LYGGLQCHHEEKRQNHFLKRRSSVKSVNDEGPTPESVIGIEYVKETISNEEVISLLSL